MFVNSIWIPEEMILKILIFLEFQDIKYLFQTNRQLKDIITRNYNYVFSNSKNNILRNFYILFEKDINSNFETSKKLDILVKNYKYEKRRQHVVCQQEDYNLYPYEKNIAPLGFHKYKNFIKLRLYGFNDNTSYFASKYIPIEKLHLVYFLYNEKFRQTDIVEVVSTKSVESIYQLVSLSRKGFCRIFSIKCIMTLDFDQIDSLCHLKKVNFPRDMSYDIVTNFDKNQINKIIMLKNLNFNYWNCIRCVNSLSDKKIELMIKLKSIFPDTADLTNLVFKTSTRNLREMIHKNEN
jgi:hypothetical protein